MSEETEISRLIDQVRAYDILYDTRNPDYGKRKHVADAWREIAKELNSNEITVKRRWWNIRSNFMREKRKSRQHLLKCGGVGVPRLISWPYFRSLQFIENCHDANETTSDVPKDNYTGNLDLQELVRTTYVNSNFSDSESPHFNYQTSCESFEEKFEIPPENYAEDRSGKETDGRCLRAGDGEHKKEVYQRALDESPATKRRREQDDLNNDPDLLFLRSLLPTMKQLGTIENLEFKAEVITLLKKKLTK